MAHDVFISCTAADKPVGDAICATLEANAIRCWIAPRDIMPGADWGASIIEAITKARLMVLVFSAKANASEHIKREVERAVNAGLPIIPVRIEDVARPTWLAGIQISLQFVYAMPPDEEALSGVVAAVRTCLTATVVPDRPAPAIENPKVLCCAMPSPRPWVHNLTIAKMLADVHANRAAALEPPELADSMVDACSATSIHWREGLSAIPYAAASDSCLPGAAVAASSSSFRYIMGVGCVVLAGAIAAAVWAAWGVGKAVGGVLKLGTVGNTLTVLVASGLSLYGGVRIRRALRKARAVHAEPTAPKDAVSKAPVPISDIVNLSAFAPERVLPSTRFIVQAFLHQIKDGDAVRIQAQQADPAATQRAQATLDVEIARGASVEMELVGSGLSIDEPLQQMKWTGVPSVVAFIVSAPPLAQPMAFRLRLSCNGIPVGSICFTVQTECTDAATSAPAGLRGDWAKRYRRAFLSYASEDRLEVFRSAQTIPALGINFFQDILSLEPGEVWQNRLRQEIADCDVFLLYWSTHAANSKWVAWEIDQALSLQEERALYKPDIKPVIIEGPPVPPPPKTLAHLHFQSLMRYLIAAEAAEHARQVPPADALMPD